jgi:putative PIN family toxin of toxin-antitoxin system
MQLVLDTNVWVDWLVFDDPSIAPLKAAYRDGCVRIVVNEACLQELNAVLAYPEFGLDETQRTALLAEVDRCTIQHDLRKLQHPATLPHCSDQDDQKFLELSRDAQADWLITRDNALLRIRRKKLEAARFRIGTPMQWASSSVN